MTQETKQKLSDFLISLIKEAIDSLLDDKSKESKKERKEVSYHAAA